MSALRDELREAIARVDGDMDANEFNDEATDVAMRVFARRLWGVAPGNGKVDFDALDALIDELETP